MPAGDRTGPMGQGPRTGRAAGFCSGYDSPGYTNPAPGRGRGWFGRGGWGGGGRGWRHWFYATGRPRWARWGWWGSMVAPPSPTREQETDALRQEATWLKEELEAINKRIEELEHETRDT